MKTHAVDLVAGHVVVRCLDWLIQPEQWAPDTLCDTLAVAVAPPGSLRVTRRLSDGDGAPVGDAVSDGNNVAALSVDGDPRRYTWCAPRACTPRSRR